MGQNIRGVGSVPISATKAGFSPGCSARAAPAACGTAARKWAGWCLAVSRCWNRKRSASAACPSDRDRNRGEVSHGLQPLAIPPRSQVSLLLDQTHLTIGYPELLVSGGRGAEIRLTYAEAMLDAKNRKGHRDAVEGANRGTQRRISARRGCKTPVSAALGAHWRYLQLDIRTGDDPLVVEDIYGIFTAYPFAEKAGFDSSDPALKAIWDTGWRTARLCAGETFFDCPYYEQLQYIGDTRVEALITLGVSGDDRLMCNAILDFHESRISDGLTASRYPSRQTQLIPPYSLFWIAMLHDYWMYRGDPGFCVRCWAGWIPFALA